MALLTLDLRPEIYQQLQGEATRKGKRPENLVLEWVLSRLSPKPVNERERAKAVLRAAGLLAEPSEEMRQLAGQVTMTLTEVRSALDRAGGRPLSEIILEQRGPKEFQ